MDLQFSFSDLVKRAANLDLDEYERFISSVNKLRAKQRHPGRPPKKELDLLAKINQGFQPEKWLRLQFLDEKMEDSGLSKLEHAELTNLTEEYEAYSVHRIQLLKKLAMLRNVSLEEALRQLGLQHGEV